MPSFADYKATARQRGALALELYVVTSTPVVPPHKMQELLPAHLDYQQAREADRSLVLAGPLSDVSGENIEGAGLIVYRAEGLAAARALAEADPMHSSGARRYDLRRWLVNEGSLTLEVGLSTGRVSLV